MPVIDTHTHLDYFEAADEAIVNAAARGVTGMVSVGCGIESIEATLDIARSNEQAVRVAAGVHPQAAASFDESTFERIAELAHDPLVVAIGETGFDQYRDYGTVDQQMPAFVLQCNLARQLGKPLVIHTRAAESATLDALAKYAHDLEVILHCYSLAEPADRQQVIDRGYWCSFAGNVTYPSAGNLREAVRNVAPERILVETDAPYLPPVPHRGKRNEPSFVVDTLAVIARELGMTLDEAGQLTTANAIRAFALPATWASSPSVAELQT